MWEHVDLTAGEQNVYMGIYVGKHCFRHCRCAGMGLWAAYMSQVTGLHGVPVCLPA